MQLLEGDIIYFEFNVWQIHFTFVAIDDIF